ncbi:MAG TPA: VWA domain-containing protein [Candidatus Binatia bacterium]|nr:VWA domain-containing protein [Candidatus Binatia bacterium]
MEFLNPTALLGFFALPLLLIPYLIRTKSRRLVFSSVLLFLDEESPKSPRPFGRVHLPPIFFLQLLLLALLILALSEPVFSIRPTSIAMVIDNSASMQALEDGKSRLALAKDAAYSIIGEADLGARIDLYLTTPRLEKLRAAPFTPSEARSALGAIKAYDMGDPPIDYGHALERLAREQKYQRVHWITDHPTRGQTATIRATTVGRPQANLAISAFDVRRSSLADARLEANVQVRNFSDREQKLKIIVKGGGIAVASRDLTLAAGASANARFDGLPEHSIYQAEISARDGLALDNRRFAVAPPSRSLKILAITPRAQAILSLKSIPGVNLDAIAPADYEKSDRTSYGLEIFHYSMPSALPRNPALFILPPESNPLVKLGAPLTNAGVSNWREAHPLTRYVNFNLFRPSYARPFKPQTAGDVVIESPDGILAFSMERQGARYLVLGFDPLPYLGRDNLPMSIFTLNFLDWFFDSGASGAQATGEPIRLGPIENGDRLTTPMGEQIFLKPEVANFPATFYQGVYQLERAGRVEAYVRNLQDPGESDLRNPATIDLQRDVASQSSGSVLFSFWPYLLFASLALLILEWFINPRMEWLRTRSLGRSLAWRGR